MSSAMEVKTCQNKVVNLTMISYGQIKYAAFLENLLTSEYT
jgi:hypothetical protein